MEQRVKTIISNIFESFQKHIILSNSLLTGEAGCCLFDSLYIKHFQKSGHFSNFEQRIQQLAENSLSYYSTTFCDGKSGINWFFTYLKENDILDQESLDIVCYDNALIAQNGLDFLKKGKYDFLHGGIGIAYQLLYTNPQSQEIFDHFFNVLNNISSKTQDGLFYIADFDLKMDNVNTSQVNIGLAHGMPSILKFCIQCCRQGICTNKAELLAKVIIDFLVNKTNKNNTFSSFPSVVNLDFTPPEFSRLGWCYGDLGIGYILYQAAIFFKDAGLEKFATDVLLLTTKRRTFEETLVADAGICHGTAGIAHVYNKMWRSTKNRTFKEACDFWIEETIKKANFPDGVGGFKSFHGQTNSYHGSYNLLDGTCGIGLVLISYITGDFSWDYCVMLND